LRSTKAVVVGGVRLLRLPLLIARRGFKWFQIKRRLPRTHELMRFGRRVAGALQYEVRLLQTGMARRSRIDPYDAWLMVNRDNEHAARHLQAALAERAGRLPKISVVMPVFQPPEGWLEIAVQSVLAQRYANWELCIADDASPSAGVRQRLDSLAARDSRIRVTYRTQNGNISAATNTAASLATGDFILFLDQDDELHPDCLAEIAIRLAGSGDADLAYTDDDKVDAHGRHYDPQFKPDWSPELLLAYMYMSHAFVVRRGLFEALGGFREGFEGSQDYDFALRAAERARVVLHVPRILYHWRALPGSTAISADAKPKSLDAGLQAVAETLSRRGIDASACQPDWAVEDRLGIYSHRFPDEGPSVTVIIPTRNHHLILEQCLKSLERTTYRNYVVLVVDNDSDDPESRRYLEHLPHRVVRIGNPGSSFNFAHINNQAAELADSEYVLFLNNDTEVIEPRWLSQMMGYARVPGVGAVGARLIFPDGRIQHAGIVHGLYQGMAGPAFKLMPSSDNGYLSYARVVRNYMAVTAACLLTPRSLFLDQGGFDSQHFGVAYNDVDYCYRLVGAGYRCVYCPEAELRHHENYSRGNRDDPREEAEFRRRYRATVDPWYNPNLSLDNERFEIEPRRVVLHQVARIRAAMFSNNLNMEGAPNSMFELAVGLRDAGVIDPVVFSPADGPLRESYERIGIPVQVIQDPLADTETEEPYEIQIRDLAKRIANQGAELVYANTLMTFAAIDAARHLGLPALWNPRESEPWREYFSFLPAPLADRAFRCFDYPYRVIFVAEATRRQWKVFDARRNFAVIHNGLNLDRVEQQRHAWPREAARAALGVRDDEVCLLLLGTICERKGQLDLVRALRDLDSIQVERVRCYLVGDRPSPYSEQLHAELDALAEPIRSRIDVVPETNATGLFYSAADVFICASRVESFPRVVLEAMAYDLPLVTTPVYGIAEQVREGVNALFYSPGDELGLGERLRQVIANDAFRHRLADNSRPMLDRLRSFEEMIASYATLFREAYLARATPLQ
jgi:GT2 family glycosyltransferase